MTLKDFLSLDAAGKDAELDGMSDEDINRLVHEAEGRCVHKFLKYLQLYGKKLLTTHRPYCVNGHWQWIGSEPLYMCKHCDLKISSIKYHQGTFNVDIPDYCNSWTHAGPLLDKMWSEAKDLDELTAIMEFILIEVRKSKVKQTGVVNAYLLNLRR